MRQNITVIAQRKRITLACHSQRTALREETASSKPRQGSVRQKSLPLSPLGDAALRSLFLFSSRCFFALVGHKEPHQTLEWKQRSLTSGAADEDPQSQAAVAMVVDGCG